MNKKLVLMGAALLMTAATASAQKRVTGRVLDTDGQPVAGASVRVEGHKGVTVTDANGNFTLQNVPFRTSWDAHSSKIIRLSRDQRGLTSVISVSYFITS